MRRIFAAAVLLSLALGLQAVPHQAEGQAAPRQAEGRAAPQRKIPCKTPENASMCYWTRGRLALYNGNPGWRIWKIGTKRILGVYSGPGSARIDPLDNEHPEFPANLDGAYEAEYRRKVNARAPDTEWPDTVFADFEVCPLEPEHAGRMQAVCIESARNIFLQRDSYVPRY